MQTGNERSSAVSLRRMLLAGAALAALVLAGTAFPASSGSVKVTTVGGQTVKNGSVSKQVSGNVAVTGTAALAGQEAAPAAKPLVADAGDTPYSPLGQAATLLGAGYGGAEPYTFSWSTSGGTLTGANAPTAQLDAPIGVHTATLTVTDSKGATATDTVKVIVYKTQKLTLLDRTQIEAVPGATAAGPLGKVEFPFEVPAGTARIDALLTYLVPTNDWDLKIFDPAGNQRAFPGEFITPAPNTDEDAVVHNPEPGTWKAVVEKFATSADQITVKVTALVAEGTATDPRPVVDSGGPYAFATGATQTLDGTAGAGAAPLTAIAWDTDLDGVFESSGADITTNLGEARHVVSLKATDANGFERRETTSLVVADPSRLVAEANPITVIGVADCGINPYHIEFSAADLSRPGRPRADAATSPATRPSTSRAIPRTRWRSRSPSARATTRRRTRPCAAGVEQGRLYWIPGTKIIGGSTPATGGLRELRRRRTPILDDDGHGTRLGSVSTGNRYGYCPTCLLFVVEALDESSSRRAPVGRHQHEQLRLRRRRAARARRPAGSQSTRAAAERGQTVLFAAGNGVGNAFDVPIATYGSDQTGARLEHHRRRDPARQPAGDRRRRHPGAHLRLGRRQPAVGVPDRHRRPVRVRRHVRGDAVHRRRLRHRPDRGPARDRRRQGRPAARPGRRQGMPIRAERLPRRRQADPRASCARPS